MTIFITGARGFIGHHVALHLSALGKTVVGLGHGAWVEADYARWGLNDWLNGQVDAANLNILAARHGVPECVIHLAGGSSVGPSFSAPAEDFRRSVDGTANLAEWIRIHSPGTPIVMASSAAVYGADHAGQISERALCMPYSPYGFHKRMAELALESYARNFAVKVACVRFFSVYGGGLRKQLLWDVCSRLAQNVDVLRLGGHGQELRDWLHVADAAKLLVDAQACASTACPIINGGTGVATPVRAIAERLVECWGSDARLEFSGIARVGDPQSLVADNSLARALKWTPDQDWQAGLAEYVAWFKAERQAVVR